MYKGLTVPKNIGELHEALDEDIGEVMSNFDGEIDYDIAEKLKENSTFYAGYAAWDFHGDIFYHEGKYYGIIWQYHKWVNTIVADTIENLKSTACYLHGYQ